MIFFNVLKNTLCYNWTIDAIHTLKIYTIESNVTAVYSALYALCIYLIAVDHKFAYV